MQGHCVAIHTPLQTQERDERSERITNALVKAARAGHLGSYHPGFQQVGQVLYDNARWDTKGLVGLDTSVLDAGRIVIAKQKGVVCCELFAGIMSGTEALLKDGFRIERLICIKKLPCCANSDEYTGQMASG